MYMGFADAQARLEHASTQPDPFDWLLQVFTELAGDDWSNRDALRACIGDIDADSNNDMMQASLLQHLALHALLLGVL